MVIVQKRIPRRRNRKIHLRASYFSLSTVPAGVQDRFWSRNFPCFCGHASNCVFRYCLISFGDAVYGIVASLYWSRAAAMWALSSFSEQQNITRHSSKEEKKFRLKKTTQKNSLKLRREYRNMEAEHFFSHTWDTSLQRLFFYLAPNSSSWFPLKPSCSRSPKPSILIGIIKSQITNGMT